MAHIIADRVGEYSTTTGTGTYSLNGGAIFGFRVFDDAMNSTDTCWYVAVMGNEWEVGLGTFTATGTDTLARTTILASTNGDAAVNWGAGTKEIYLGFPAAALRGRKGADVTSATTVVLDNVAGDIADMNGTTPITAITLAEGRAVTIRFTTATTLTHGASLVLPGEANITTALNDFAIFRGYAAGVVRVVLYQRANGAPVSLAVPGAIGGTTPSTGAFTTLSATSTTAFGNATPASGQFSTGATGLVSQRIDSAGLPVNYNFINQGINGVSQGGNFRFSFGTGGAAGATAAEMATISTADWSSAGNRSAKYRFNAVTAGSLAVEMDLGNGAQFGAPSGGAKGVGTVNAVAVYDDNVLLTCYVLEAFRDGALDPAKWDARVPDRFIPEFVEVVDVTEEVEADTVKLVPSADGSRFTAVPERRMVTRPKTVRRPIVDQAGNEIDAIEEQVTERRVRPERIERRQHLPARAFAARLDDLDPDVFTAKWKATGVLPGMPTPEEFAARPPSTGEMIQRLWELCELQAVHIAKLSERIPRQ